MSMLWEVKEPKADHIYLNPILHNSECAPTSIDLASTDNPVDSPALKSLSTHGEREEIK